MKRIMLGVCEENLQLDPGFARIAQARSTSDDDTYAVAMMNIPHQKVGCARGLLGAWFKGAGYIRRQSAPQCEGENWTTATHRLVAHSAFRCAARSAVPVRRRANCRV